MARRAFYSFHYKPDNWRAAMVRNIGAIEGNKPASGNDWEGIKKGGDTAIQSWIAVEMHGRSCTVVLVGTNTANRKWIDYEIVKSWDNEMGVVGICIHGLKDRDGTTSIRGANPFEYIGYGNTGRKLSSIVKCYNPVGSNSQERYDWIKRHLASVVEEAISIRQNN